MDRRAIRRTAGIGLCLLALAALAWIGRPGTGLRLFAALDETSLRAGLLKKSRPAVRRDRFPGLQAPLVIQQIGLGDPAGPQRRDGFPADWIEVLNNASRPVSLEGFALSDGPSPSRRWTFPDVVLPGGESLIVWADGFNRVGSCWESGDPLRRPVRAWVRRPEADSLAGYVFRGAQTSARLSPELVFEIAAPGGACDLWLRLRAEGETSCLLEAQAGEQPARPVAAAPGKRFQTVQLRPAGRDAAGWELAAGPVRIKLRLKRGVVAVDRMVLTRRGEPFGRGVQDFHASFKLKAAGETIGLYAPRGIPLDHVQFPALASGAAYARVPRGSGGFAVVEQPSGGKAAMPPPPPEFSIPSGFVSSGALVSVQAGAGGGTVRYTTDGSLPDETSPAWRDLEIREPVILTARGFRDGAAPSQPVTRLYHPGPAPDIPLVWLALRPEAESNLLRYRLARGRLAEQRAHACIFFPDGTAQSADVALRPQGRSSRLEKVKQAYRIVCRKELGAEYWPGTIYSEPGAARHGSLVLNAISLVKHPVARDAFKAAGFVAPRQRQVLFQINRDPLGVYLLWEDPNDPEFWRHAFGHLDLDVIKLKTQNPVKAGTARAYGQLWRGLDTEAGLAPDELRRWIDPVYFSCWVAWHHLLGIADNQQGYFVRDRRKTEAPWSFIIWDLDGAFNWALRDHAGQWPPLEGERKEVFRSLLRNEPGSRLFADTARAVADHGLDADFLARRAADYAETVVRHIDFEWAGREFQGVEDGPADREGLAGIFRQAAADVREFLASQPGLYRDSLADR